MAVISYSEFTSFLLLFFDNFPWRELGENMILPSVLMVAPEIQINYGSPCILPGTGRTAEPLPIHLWLFPEKQSRIRQCFSKYGPITQHPLGTYKKRKLLGSCWDLLDQELEEGTSAIHVSRNPSVKVMDTLVWELRVKRWAPDWPKEGAFFLIDVRKVSFPYWFKSETKLPPTAAGCLFGSVREVSSVSTMNWMFVSLIPISYVDAWSPMCWYWELEAL